jgi:hypothetical protein
MDQDYKQAIYDLRIFVEENTFLDPQEIFENEGELKKLLDEYSADKIRSVILQMNEIGLSKNFLSDLRRFLKRDSRKQ